MWKQQKGRRRLRERKRKKEKKRMMRREEKCRVEVGWVEPAVFCIHKLFCNPS